ncbi:MAG: hypothetical protein ACUVXJ_20155, partial [Phycisphaerae bacterium]
TSVGRCSSFGCGRRPLWELIEKKLPLRRRWLKGGRPTLSDRQVLTCYARRWALEVTFQEAKAHLGFEEPQGWTRRAVERTAPTTMLLNSLIVLWFVQAGHRHLSFPHRPWYRWKCRAAFADMLTTLRRQSLRERFLETPAWDEGSQKSLQPLLDLCSRAA